MNINIFRGDLTDVSAKTKSLTVQPLNTQTSKPVFWIENDGMQKNDDLVLTTARRLQPFFRTSIGYRMATLHGSEYWKAL